MSSRGSLPSPVAIDGPAASGKTTVAEALAAAFGYRFLDTGLMYRAFTLAALRGGVAAEEGACEGLLKRSKLSVRGISTARVFLDDEDVTDLLREEAVEQSVSRYAALPVVRAAMLEVQRSFAREAPVILVGRDIGTIVLPDAPVKFYLQASEEARAARRTAQADAWGQHQNVAETKREISERDKVDASRVTSPMRPADDAIVVDTTNMTLEQVVAFVMERVSQCAA